MMIISTLASYLLLASEMQVPLGIKAPQLINQTKKNIGMVPPVDFFG
jgi:hypothetical protein